MAANLEQLDRWRLCQELRSYAEMRRSRGALLGTDPAEWEEWLGWIEQYAGRIEDSLATKNGPDVEPFDETAYY